MSWLEGVKDQFNWSVEDAAREEINQGTRRGYDPSRGKEGDIKRGLFEQARDWVLQNDPDAIRRKAQEIYTEDLKGTTKGEDVADFRPSFEITSSTTQSELDNVHREVARRQPLITQIKATGELSDKYTLEELRAMDVDSLSTVLKQARGKETITDYNNNPVIQQQLADARQDRITSDKRWNATQQMSIAQMGLAQQQQANQMQIAQMNNQLERRRMDMADRRTDRRDRQAMIQQLMSGLSTLGASIAI